MKLLLVGSYENSRNGGFETDEKSIGAGLQLYAFGDGLDERFLADFIVAHNQGAYKGQDVGIKIDLSPISKIKGYELGLLALWLTTISHNAVKDKEITHPSGVTFTTDAWKFLDESRYSLKLSFTKDGNGGYVGVERNPRKSYFLTEPTERKNRWHFGAGIRKQLGGHKYQRKSK
ncbi:MAG: hypothetical protein U9O94_01010 [Nanoarchaeota archaeon]|nr:hypothetical protein [Nanoarchaeota archaeon]